MTISEKMKNILCLICFQRISLNLINDTPNFELSHFQIKWTKYKSNEYLLQNINSKGMSASFWDTTRYILNQLILTYRGAGLLQIHKTWSLHFEKIEKKNKKKIMKI